MFNQKHAESSREKISNALKGKKKSEEQKRKMSLSKGSKPFLVHTIEGRFVGRFETSPECAEKLGLTATNILSCLRGKRLSHGGYTFKHVEVTSEKL